MIRFVLRTTLISLAVFFALPMIAGVHFHGDWIAALVTSLIFNVVFLGLEWLLGALVFGINISTLGLGAIITSGLKFFANILAPAVALVGTAHIMPRFIDVTSYYPGALVGGLALGGLLWVTVPDKKK
jgi:hypothetical protein